ncbi:FkbM family methyltransferase [Paenibacillus sp. GCM10023248]|uniref:FkbM family methyltransferase n=1 Tax=unclassified Paenibacillus TaxID=185978 RepID=UPI002377DEEC|nr:FkbM family methyltransferase [Paenibacillus sp. MAHUQ-63]MDD9270458.1 FkbM family methyltransferase [Paenibacillus sp. MAHUQ-63]
MQPYIERSKTAHPNRSKIQTVYAMASDVDQENQSFYIHEYWSGLSSASLAKADSLKPYTQHYITSITLDSLLSKHALPKERLLFKIDVEGHEEKVMKGMLHSIERCPRMLGFIEFDSKYLAKSGTDADAFLTFLEQRFNVYIYINNQELVRFGRISLTKLQALFKKQNIHTDIILASNDVDIPKIYSQLTLLE